MRRTTVVSIILLTIAAAGQVLAAAYGSGVTLADATPLSAILADPQSFAGKTVLVRGQVVEVCAARGCWLDLAGDKAYEKIRVKVEDGVIVFPLSARGRSASVQGTVELMRLCPEEAARQADGGRPSEAAFAIRATGAVID